MLEKEVKYWSERAVGYSKQEWANDDGYLAKFIEAAKPEKSDIVLDVGCGTGLVAQRLAPLVNQVVGLDISEAMMNKGKWENPVRRVVGDVRAIPFPDETFDTVTARHVFHHVTEGLPKAIDECYRVLVPGGRIVVSEGVPPSEGVTYEFKKIFSLKEKRLVFSWFELVRMLLQGGFHSVGRSELRVPSMSVRNWLSNSWLPQITQDEIFELHANGSDEFKRAYNLSQLNGDIWIDLKMVIVWGRK